MTLAAPMSVLLDMPLAGTKVAPAAARVVKISSIDPLSDPMWDRLVSSHPESDVFHSSAWARVLHHTYGHLPFYYSFAHGSKPVALLPMMEARSPLSGNRGICLPFTDSCSPLYFDEGMRSQVMLEHLVKVARQRKWKYFEVRQRWESLAGAKPSVTFYHHTLDLQSGPEELLRRFASPVRRAIRKAERSGLVASLSTEWQAIVEFYGLHVQTRRRHGVPPQPLAFFRNIYEHVVNAGLGFVILVRQGSRAVAGAMFFHSGRKALFKFGASDASLNEFRGNNLAMWEGIRTLSERGFATLDFGRTSLANEGLRRFKLSWATIEETVAYCKFDTASHAWVKSRDRAAGIHSSLFRNLPLPLNRLAGRLLYPHLD